MLALRGYGVKPRLDLLSCLNKTVFRLRFPSGSKILKLVPGAGGASTARSISSASIATADLLMLYCGGPGDCRRRPAGLC